jgi:hypothetical protein
MRRFSKDLIKAIEALGFEHVWTNSQGYFCYVHGADPDQTEVLISPSVNECTAKLMLRKCQKIAGVAPKIEKRRASQVKERAATDRERAHRILQVVRERHLRLVSSNGDREEIERVSRLVALRERELADLERLMQEPPSGGRVHRGSGQVRHVSGAH